MLLRQGDPALVLERVRLGSRDHAGTEREGFIQDLVHDHPDLIPMVDIEPAFTPLVSICRELQLESGQLDNLWMTPTGAIVLGECKLFRNPEARRQVIVQALDYARAVSALGYPDLEAAVRKALKDPAASLFRLMGARSDLEEAQFVDAVERRLRQGRLMVLIIGDGIQEGVEGLTAHLQLHAGMHAGLALVDLSLWRDPHGGLLVLPRIPLKTHLVERGVVSIDPAGIIKILSPQKLGTSSAQPGRPISASEPEFFEQLALKRPDLGATICGFLAVVAQLGIQPEYRRSLILRWNASPDFDASPGYIETSGRVWFGSGWNTANRLGIPSAGERYLETIAKAMHGRVTRPPKNFPDVVGQDGRSIDVAKLLALGDVWPDAIAGLIASTRAAMA